MLSLLLGLLIANLSIEFIQYILTKFVKPVPYKLYNISLFVVGIFWVYFFSLIPNNLMDDFMTVYASDGVDKNNNDFFKLFIKSPLFDQELSLNLRSVGDVAALSLIGKFTISAVKSSPVPVKAAVAKYFLASNKLTATIGTVTAMGTIYLGIRILEHIENQKRVFTITKNDKNANLIIEPNPELGGTEKDVEEVIKNIKINSPYETSEILNGIKMILFCTEILSTLVIISFIFYSLFIFIKYVNFNKFKINNVICIKFINLVQKASIIYVLFWGGLTLFNISVILYLNIRLSNFLDTLTV